MTRYCHSEVVLLIKEISLLYYLDNAHDRWRLSKKRELMLKYYAMTEKTTSSKAKRKTFVSLHLQSGVEQRTRSEPLNKCKQITYP